ncbi:MAG: flagellar basal body-associated FliL family protein [Firmicutes bacterium]|nr:flagellar basal body-associated FliL family protein [Bacillota bacterium]NLL88082.1 flagellar basal body-associated FliL family protein [Bacillota bacterium]HKM17077.1 flagellar basal body-associated FliL family protein [Limnochordia bacterium]
MSKKVEVDFRFVIVALALVIIASVGSAFTAYMMLARNTPNTGAEKADGGARDIGPTYEIGEFTVNLAGTNSIRFIRTGIVLEFTKDSDVREAERREPQIRDRIITILRTCTLADLSAPDGLVQLKAKLIGAINELFGTEKVSDIFFIDLVFQ